MSFGSKMTNYSGEILRDLKELVAIPSVREEAAPGAPFGEPCRRVLDRALEMAEAMGLRTKNLDGYIGYAEYGEGEETAAVLAHLDVVPAGSGWDTPPFTATEKDGLLFGRGVADDKGAAVAALYGLKALKDAGVKGNRRIRVIFGVSEETGMEDMEEYLRREPLPAMAFTPDGAYGACNREKGILRVTFTAPHDGSRLSSFHAGLVVNAVPDRADAVLACTPSQWDALQTLAAGDPDLTVAGNPECAEVSYRGAAAHAMQPTDGKNAASYLLEALFQVFSAEELGTLPRFLHQCVGLESDGASAGVKQSDEPSGSLTLNLGLVSVANGEASASFDIRYPVTADGRAIAAELETRAKASGVALKKTDLTEPLYLPADSALIQLLLGAYREVMGEDAPLYSTGGGTYARSLKGRGVACGPFFPGEPDRRPHNANENIEIEKFLLHTQICLEAMYRMFTA